LLKHQTTKEQYNQPEIICQLIKKFPLILTDFAPLDDAISTVGGISLEEVHDNLELKKLPNHYCVGEMLDWDAPTGGYLLQACFSMGSFLAHQLTFPSFEEGA
jgi:predicted flavoprotein YhiN